MDGWMVGGQMERGVVRDGWMDGWWTDGWMDGWWTDGKRCS